MRLTLLEQGRVTIRSLKYIPKGWYWLAAFALSIGMWVAFFEVAGKMIF
jgi:hypothetical protein